MSDLSTRARELIAAVNDGDRPTNAEKARLRAAVLARVGTAVAVGSAITAVAANAKGAPSVAAVATAGGTNAGATVATKTALAAFGAKWLVLLAVVASATGYAVVSSRTGSAVAASPSAGPAQRSPSTPVLASPPPLTREVVAPGPTALEGRAHSRSASASVLEAPPGHRKDAPRGPSTPRSPDTFGDETAALAAALGALRDGTPSEALMLLDEQDAHYSEGALGEERAATRIDALCALGRTDEARAAADRFIASHPRSVLRSRVSATCNVETPK